MLTGLAGSSLILIPLILIRQMGGYDGVQAEHRFGHVRVVVVVFVRGAIPDNEEARVLVEIEIIITAEFPSFWYSGDVDVKGRIVVLRVAQEFELLLDFGFHKPCSPCTDFTGKNTGLLRCFVGRCRKR